MDAVADQRPSGEPRLGECAALVRGLAAAVFPSSGVGVLMGGARAAGPGWASVRAWAQVEDGLRKSGPGSIALVLGRRQDGRLDGRGLRASRPGHAWAAYLLADRTVAWVDLLRERGSRLSSTPEGGLSRMELLREQGRGRSPLELPPLEGRAVIVGPSRRVELDALEPFAQSDSLAQALVDAPTGRDYAGDGSEAEDRQPPGFAGEGDPRGSGVPRHGASGSTPGADLVRVRALEEDSARRFAEILAGAGPVDVGQLLRVMTRRASIVGSESTPAFEAEVRRWTGLSPVDLLYRAVVDRRLVQRHAETVVRGLGYEPAPFGQGLGDVAVDSWADPAELPQVRSFARRLHGFVASVDGQGARDLLRTLDRDLTKLWPVFDAYSRLFNMDLRTVLGVGLQEQNHSDISHVMGDPIQEPVPWELARLWYERLEGLEYQDSNGNRLSLPFNYPEAGDELRSHAIALKLRQWGAPVRKISVA
ncbi:hypothetical protein [Streptomyces sp. GESEQ-35]|uniref:hypothetical protein n=1 Tax=Streptomyces sp. GESEQ-35 TaxID=2812657 RepID=UPI001B33BE80|nr:hypothetical protein [Streptomyces sp. GESEQ-35]